MSDVMRTLREARPDELSPHRAIPEEVRRAELARAMASRPAGGRAAEGRTGPRRRVRPVWGLALAGAAAAAAAAIVVLPSDDGPARHAATPPPAPQRLDARTILLAAAEKSAQQPDTLRAFWHTTTVQRGYYTTQAGYTVVTAQKDEGWTPSRPGGRTHSRTQNLGARPATAEDKAAWVRAGSPSTFELGVAGPRGILKPLEAKTAPGPVQRSTGALVDGDKVFWLGRNVTMKQLRALPADPRRLKAELLRWYKGHDTESDGVPMSSDAWLYRVGGTVVVDLPVRPKVRAAAFRMLAELKSVQGIGEVKDAEGRTGSAIAMNGTGFRGLTQDRLIIDPVTGNALAEEHILLKPARGERRPAGALLDSNAILTMDWTDTAPN